MKMCSINLRLLVPLNDKLLLPDTQHTCDINFFSYLQGLDLLREYDKVELITLT